MTPTKIGNYWYDRKGMKVPSPNGREEKLKKQEEMDKVQLKLPLDNSNDKNNDPKENKKPNPS